MSNISSELSIKPLSEADVEAQKKKLLDADPKVLTDIYNTCLQLLNSMMVMILKQTDDEDEIVEIERLKRVINLAPIEEGFLRSKDKLWAAREHILNKNAAWFLDKDYKALIKKDHNQVFIETLVGLVKDRYNTLLKEDKDKYWEKLILLLRNIARFKKLVGEK